MPISSYFQLYWSSSILVVFHFSKSSKLVLSSTRVDHVRKQVLFICSYFTTSSDGSAGGWAGGLKKTKLKLTQPSLVELELGLSLAIKFNIKTEQFFVMISIKHNTDANKYTSVLSTLVYWLMLIFQFI